MNLFFLRLVRRARWHLLGCALGLPVLAVAQAPPTAPSTSTPPHIATASATSPASTATQVRFDIEIQTESRDLRDFLLRHIELQRFRELPDLDDSELSRLVDQVPDNLGDLLGTLGHFNPIVAVQVFPAAGEVAAPLGRVVIQVEPGPLTRVESVLIAFRGEITDLPQAAEQRAAIENAFSMKPGDRFTQADWDSAKAAALRTLTATRYPAGRIHGSLADIDPSNQTVRLALELDSGAPVRIGEVRVEGAERYDSAAAQNLVRLSGLVEGSDYNLRQLQEAQRRIAETGYYASVFVYVEPSADQQLAPVRVQVRESRRQKVVFGVGASTDNGARLSIEHTHHRLPGIGWRAMSKLLIERDDQLIATDWSSPVDRRGWRWIAGAQAARQIDGFNTTTSQRLRLGQAQDNLALDRSFFLQYDRAISKNSLIRSLGPGVAESALTGNYAWTRRRFDDLVQPNSGHGLGIELGAGTTLSPIRRPFVRSHLRWLGYWPIGSVSDDPVPSAAVTLQEGRRAPPSSNAGRLALRLEGGAVWAQKDAPVPETQLFLTGGDGTVRGYGLRDIGIAQADGGVRPGRYLAVTSLEWQRPLVRQGVRTPWESVLFVDAGAVADQPGDLRASWSVGTGLRYKSPVGPLQVDLAYGLDDKRLRLHLSVGFTF
jgi:translocation and assembly module TamA